MFARTSLIVGLLVVGSTAHAAPLLSYDISISSDDLTGSLDPVFDRVTVTDPNGPIENTLSFSASQNHGIASAVADFGRLQVQSEIVIDPGDGDGSLDAVQAIAMWQEFITIHAPSLDGSAGTFWAQVRVTGSLDAESIVEVLETLKSGATPTPGPQIDRQTSAPVGGPTTLTELDFASE